MHCFELQVTTGNVANDEKPLGKRNDFFTTSQRAENEPDALAASTTSDLNRVAARSGLVIDTGDSRRRPKEVALES
jgi:hypothetical protein